MAIPTDPSTWPALLKRAEVLALTRCSVQSLNRAIEAGALPRPNELGLWPRDALLAALGLVAPHTQAAVQSRMEFGFWPTDPSAIHQTYLSILPDLEQYQMSTFRRTTGPEEMGEPARTGSAVDISTTHEPCLHGAEEAFAPSPNFVPTADTPMNLVTLTKLALRSLKIKSIKSVLSHLRKAFAWSASIGHPDFRRVTPAEIDCFLDHTFSTVSVQLGVKSALRRLFNEAVSHGWLETNPIDGTKERKHPKPPITLWFHEDLESYVEAALEMGDAAYAAFIIVQFELGQRISDLLRINSKSVFFDGYHFVFWQQKTGEFSDLPVSDQARARIRGFGLDPKKPLFTNHATNKVYTNDVLREHHVRIARRVVAKGGRCLTLAKLRHSCVADLADAGCTVLEIASVTGHAPNTITRILDFYFKGRSHLAVKAQVKRGLTYRDAGPDPSKIRGFSQNVQMRSAWAAVDSELAGRLPSIRRMVMADYLRRNRLFMDGDYRPLEEVLDAKRLDGRQTFEVELDRIGSGDKGAKLAKISDQSEPEDEPPLFLTEQQTSAAGRRRRRDFDSARARRPEKGLGGKTLDDNELTKGQFDHTSFADRKTVTAMTFPRGEREDEAPSFLVDQDLARRGVRRRRG